jgi:hypothetical protein
MLCAALCAVALTAACSAKPNPLPGKWEGENTLTGKTVYWEFLPDGRLYTNNFTTQQQFRYRVEQPDVLRISFSGKFQKDVQQDELVYHFTAIRDQLCIYIGNHAYIYKRVLGE